MEIRVQEEKRVKAIKIARPLDEKQKERAIEEERRIKEMTMARV